jgi:hypothetical protein
MEFYSQGPEMLYDSHGLKGLKFPDRGDTMYLNVIRPKDVPEVPAIEKDYSLSLMTEDIAGAKPLYRHNDFFLDGKPDKEEPALSRPKKYYPEMRRVIDMPLTTIDIEKAQPSLDQFKTARCCNPLQPKYDLPSCKMRPATPPQQKIHDGEVRDTLQFKGEWTPRILERNYARNPNESRDIEFSQSNVRKRLQGTTPRDVFKVIEKAGERILSSRNRTPRETHPLNPEYSLSTCTTHPFRRSERGAAMAPQQVGPVEGSTSRRLHVDNYEPQASLICGDLPGAMSQAYKGVLPFNIYDPPEITPISRGTQLDCSDIEGAQTGTKKHGT